MTWKLLIEQLCIHVYSTIGVPSGSESMIKSTQKEFQNALLSERVKTYKI